MRSIATATTLAGMLFGVSVAPVSAASFDCDRADLAADEKVICDTRTLNDADVKMVTTFDILTSFEAMGNRDRLREAQSAWLKKRQACGEDVECIRTTYDARLKELDEAFKTLSQPF